MSEDGVAAAAVSSKQHRKPETLLTKDLQLLQNPVSFFVSFFVCLFVCFVLFFVFCFFCSAHLKESSFLVLSDSVPSLQAMHNKKLNHPIFINIHDTSGFDSR